MKMLRQKAKPTVTGLKMKRSGDTPGRPEYSGAFCGWLWGAVTKLHGRASLRSVSRREATPCLQGAN